MGASLGLSVRQDGFQSFEIGVDIAEDRVLDRVVIHDYLHGSPRPGVSVNRQLFLQDTGQVTNSKRSGIYKRVALDLTVSRPAQPWPVQAKLGPSPNG